jgi:hypothetical protein
MRGRNKKIPPLWGDDMEEALRTRHETLTRQPRTARPYKWLIRAEWAFTAFAVGTPLLIWLLWARSGDGL